MNLDTFRELLGKRGQVALREAAALAPTEVEYLTAFTKLEKHVPAELARAALETVLLRDRARSRHSRADRFYFTRESLEQSSSEAVARYRAKRFARFGTVLDLCCGVGMDAVALAEAGCTVHAIESDPVKAAMAEANAAAAGIAERVHVHVGDVLTIALPAADAAFADPSRRSGERRHLDPEEYQPPLSAVLARFPAGFPIGVKIAPAVARRDFESLDAEAEFVTLGGELKECVLWFGGLETATRRATVLSWERGRPGREEAIVSTLFEGSGSVAGGTPALPDQFLFDPDSSVIRADLLDLLAEQLGAAPLEHGIALLSGPDLIPSPFTTPFRIESVLPFKIEMLRDHLRSLGVGRVTILKRAIDVDVNSVQKKLKLAGTEHRHVILTRIGGKAAAIVATIAE
jgi:SAM-dependent methyltransferase